MQNTVLTKIVADKAVWVEARKASQPLERFITNVTPSTRHFYDALKADKTAFILECKKASPSHGVICDDFDPVKIAEVYADYASAVSVLTDEKYFHGSFDFLTQVSNTLSQPVLCKDFIIDPYQIYLARFYQADACLLMLSVLDDKQYRELSDVAHQLNMGVLTEVSNEDELERALALGAKVVGINNRNLRDLSIDLNRTRELAPRLPKDITIISESGIHNYAQIRELSQYVDGFLIGSALMREQNLHAAVRCVLLGENKVCGLTRVEDAQYAWQTGAVYGGLIFVPSSPRFISDVDAAQIVASVPLKYVGVFRDTPIDEIIAKATALNLTAIQLHGHEDSDYIHQLRGKLPTSIEIWKALSVKDTAPQCQLPFVDRYILDNAQGGSGQCFNWSLLEGLPLNNVMLAGGLNENNCIEAARLGCLGLDFNSGVESASGIKDINKLTAVFKSLRDY